MSLSEADVRFWHCLVPEHTAVTWEGDQARCTCGLTSEHTALLIERAKASQKQEIILWLYDQAAKIRAAAGEKGPGLPAIVLETAARMLADQASGQ